MESRRWSLSRKSKDAQFKARWRCAKTPWRASESLLCQTHIFIHIFLTGVCMLVSWVWFINPWVHPFRLKCSAIFLVKVLPAWFLLFLVLQPVWVLNSSRSFNCVQLQIRVVTNKRTPKWYSLTNSLDLSLNHTQSLVCLLTMKYN